MIQPKETLKNISTNNIEQYARPCTMKLNANENYLGPSPKVMKRLEKINIKDISQYPCCGELIELLCRENNVNFDNIAPTNGADGALYALISSYLDKNEAIISVSPSLETPEIHAALAGGEYRKIAFKECWEFPQEDFLAEIDEKVKIILFTNPNNPTGSLVPKEFIEKTARLYPQKLVIIDETYATYADCSCIALCRDYENVAIVRSMSKDYALAGLRIGYIISNKEIISTVKKALCAYPVNSIALIAAKEAISDKKYLDFLKTENAKAKEYLKNELSRLGAVVYPSYTNFLLVDFGEKAPKVFQKLEQNGILVKNYTTGRLKNHLRITIPSLNASKRLINALAPENLFIFDLDGVIAAQNDGNEQLLISPELLYGLESEKCLYSERSGEETADFLEKFGLNDAFSLKITRDDLPEGSKKPDCAGIDLIRNEIPAKNIFFLGDTAEDMQCAKKSGITGIGVLAPNDKSDGQKDYLFVSGAKYVLNDVNELFSEINKIKQEQNI